MYSKHLIHVPNFIKFKSSVVTCFALIFLKQMALLLNIHESKLQISKITSVTFSLTAVPKKKEREAVFIMFSSNKRRHPNFGQFYVL